jgi:hypothetical protein
MRTATSPPHQLRQVQQGTLATDASKCVAHVASFRAALGKAQRVEDMIQLCLATIVVLKVGVILTGDPSGHIWLGVAGLGMLAATGKQCC